MVPNHDAFRHGFRRWGEMVCVCICMVNVDVSGCPRHRIYLPKVENSTVPGVASCPQRDRLHCERIISATLRSGLSLLELSTPGYVKGIIPSNINGSALHANRTADAT
jgi:hypothetical protein